MARGRKSATPAPETKPDDAAAVDIPPADTAASGSRPSPGPGDASIRAPAAEPVPEAAPPEVAAGPEPAPDAIPEPEAGVMPEADGPPIPAGPEPAPVAAPEPLADPMPGLDSRPAPAVGGSRGGFWPTLLGGVIAAAIGFLAAWYLLAQQGDGTDTIESRLAAQEESLATLSAQVAAIPPTPDLSPLVQDINTLRSALDSRMTESQGRAADLGAAVGALASRLDALERAPAGGGTLPDTALAAWEGDLEGLRSDLASLAERVDALAGDLDSRDATLRDEIAQAADDAGREASATLREAARTQLRAALDSGVPFADALATATDAPPPGLAALAESGAPTMAALRDAFPDAARAALNAVRSAGLAEDGNGLAGWLRGMLNVRSTEPRAGDDADAILSRAEAALAAGDLDTALATLDDLPDAAQEAMSPWLAQAEARQQALAEAQALASSDN